MSLDNDYMDENITYYKNHPDFETNVLLQPNIHDYESCSSVSQEMNFNELNARLKKVGSCLIKRLKKEKQKQSNSRYDLSPTKDSYQKYYQNLKSHQDSSNVESAHEEYVDAAHHGLDNISFETTGARANQDTLSEKSLGVEFEILSKALKKNPENRDLSQLIIDLLEKSENRKMNNISDSETHFFKSVKILEDQLKKKSKEANYYKTLYNENKNKLNESESVKNILKNVINIQKNAYLHSPKNTNKVSSQIFLPSVSIQSHAEKVPEPNLEEKNKFYVYKQSQPPSKSSTPDELSLLRKTIDTNQAVLNSIKQLLKNKSSDVQLYDSRDIDNLPGENISSYVELIIDEYCKLKSSTTSESETTRHSESLLLKDLCSDLFRSFTDKILQVLGLLNDSNSFTSVLNDHKNFIDSLICRIETSKLSHEYKRFLLSSIVKIKRDYIDGCNLISLDGVKSITDIKNEFNQYLCTALTYSDTKILQGIFLTQNDESSEPPPGINADIPIHYDGLIEIQPLQSQSICFKDTVDILNTFFSTLIYKAHNRYTKAIRIWADQSSQYHQEFTDIQRKYFLLISSISKVVNERETFPMQTDDQSVADLENKITQLSDIKKLNEGLNYRLEEKQLELHELEQKLKKDPRTSVLCKKFDEFLNQFSDENYDDDTRESIHSIIVSFDTLLDRFLKNRSDSTVEIAENLEKNCNNYLDNIGKCSQSFSSKLNELKTIVDSYQMNNTQHTAELGNLNKLLDESNSKIVRLEEELEKMESTNALNYEIFDSTTKIADIYDSVLRYSTDIIQKGSEFMKTRNEIITNSENLDHSLKNNSSCSSATSVSFDEDIFKYIENADVISEEAHIEEIPKINKESSVSSNIGQEQKSDKNEVCTATLEASSKLSQLEEAIQQLYTVNQELINSQKLYETSDRETSNKINTFIKSLNLYSIKRDILNESVKTNTDSSSNLTDENENSQPSIPSENAAQLSFTPTGPILHF